jgi:hypothetical protein
MDFIAVAILATIVAPFYRLRDPTTSRLFMWAAVLMSGFAVIWWAVGFLSGSPILRDVVLAVVTLFWLTSAFKYAVMIAVNSLTPPTKV